MESELKTQYFLGANSRYGFRSLYGGFVGDERPQRVWALKGGPGCGKSSFLRQVAGRMEEAGLEVEYILCSGDPDSLDGIRIPAAEAVLADGTAPHVIEPPRPGAGGFYLDLGSCYIPEELAGAGPELDAVKAAYQAEYAGAYRYLSAAGTLGDELRETVRGAEAGVIRRAEGIAAREFGRRAPKPGRKRLRFLDAVTCRGTMTLYDTALAACARIWALDRDLGLSSPMVETLRDRALEAGLDVVYCPDPLEPERGAHLLIPALSLAFLSVGSRAPLPVKPERRLRLDAHLPRESARAVRTGSREIRRLMGELTGAAVARLAEAKRLHDELERIYNPHVDFSAVYAMAEETSERILRGL